MDIFWNLLFNFERINYNSFCFDYNNTATIQQQESTEYNIGKILSSSFVIATIFAPFGGILAAYFNWLLNPRLSLVILGLLSSLLVILIKSYEKKLTKKRTAIFIKED